MLFLAFYDFHGIVISDNEIMGHTECFAARLILTESEDITMIANYHTHTWRCNHASGSEWEYVENGLKSGLQILGFSDHSPYIFPEGYYSSFRMKLSQLDDYVDTVLKIRLQYENKIEIPMGLELEYYPGLLPKLLPVLKDRPFDYVILGQHFIWDEYDGQYNGLSSYSESVLEKYCDQTIEAMQTGLFTYLAHPDLMNFCGDKHIYQRQMRRICREAKSCGIPLEYNLLGLAGRRHYPNAYFWELAAEEGCDVILGRDAHDPAALLDRKTEEKALQQLKEFDLSPLNTVTLRKI